MPNPQMDSMPDGHFGREEFSTFSFFGTN